MVLIAYKWSIPGSRLRKWSVSNYFFWEGFGVVAPETCLESRCLKRKQFERMSQEELLLRHSRIRIKGLPRCVPNLIYHCDASLLGFILQLKHCWGDITGCDNILLVSDGRFDDCCMESIRDQAMTKSFFATSASRAFSSVTSREIGCAFLTPAGASWHFRGFCTLGWGQQEMLIPLGMFSIPTDTSMPASLRTSRVLACHEARTEHENFPVNR